MKQIVIGFGLLVFALLVLFQLARLSHFRSDLGTEFLVAGFCLVFLGLGIYLSRKFFHKEVIREKEVILEKEVIVEVPVPHTIDERQLEKTGLSKREYEILQLINDGLSNQQIADRLFVSENTIKKHISSVFLKLDVERRTEAIKKGKALKII